MSDTPIDTSQHLNNDASVQTPVASATQTDSPASTTGPADTAVSGQPPADGSTEEPKPNRDRRAEKRIASLTRKNEELLTRLGRLEGMMEVRLPQAQQQPDANAKPQPSQFKSYDEYVEALTDWKTEQKLAAHEKARGEQSRKESAHSKEEERHIALADRLMESGKDIEDFEDVMATITSPGFPVSAAMRDYLEDCEHPAHMAQWMAENPKDAGRIYGMNSAAAVRALDKVAAEVAPKTQRSQTTAPPPVPTVGGRSVVTRKPEDMSMDEYAKDWKARQRGN